MPDSLSPAHPLDRIHRAPALPERFLPPSGFIWGSFTAADGAVLRWGHLPVATPRAECVMVGGFGEFIEKQFETVRDLAARGIAVWCLDWRGQGGSIRPRRLPTRPRARKFDRDAEDLAAFAAEKLRGPLPRLLPNCTLIELPESKHDPFLERDAIRDYWLSCLDRFIAERLVKTAH